MFETQSCHGSVKFTFLSGLLQVFRSEELGHRSVSGTTDYNLRERQRELVIHSACKWWNDSPKVQRVGYTIMSFSIDGRL
jgi:hypothetical protein